jgi:hypothetical protein
MGSGSSNHKSESDPFMLGPFFAQCCPLAVERFHHGIPFGVQDA